jgi:hypothetical protein
MTLSLRKATGAGFFFFRYLFVFLPLAPRAPLDRSPRSPRLRLAALNSWHLLRDIILFCLPSLLLTPCALALAPLALACPALAFSLPCACALLTLRLRSTFLPLMLRFCVVCEDRRSCCGSTFSVHPIVLFDFCLMRLFLFMHSLFSASSLLSVF